MVTPTEPGGIGNRHDERAWNEARRVVRDQLEESARQGPRRMQTEALQDEVQAYLGRPRCGSAAWAPVAGGRFPPIGRARGRTGRDSPGSRSHQTTHHVGVSCRHRTEWRPPSDGRE